MQRSVRADWSGLGVRVLSAVVLAPVFLAAIYLGRPYADALVIAGGGAMAYEWARLTAVYRVRLAEAVALVAVVGAVAARGLGGAEIGLGLLAAGALAALALYGGRVRCGGPLAFGILYLGGACLGFLWLRERPEVGLAIVAWLIAVVWTTDVGAYLVGRSLGGPRLARRISPGKTWSGLLGGVLCAAGISVLAGIARPDLAAALGLGGLPALIAVGAGLGVVAQGGDLLESAVKRRAGVKNASGLIPGHGGVLDRCDGLLAASLALALLVALGQAGT